MKIYLFGAPNGYGGGRTKLAHLISLLHREWEIVVVPDVALNWSAEALAALSARGVRVCSWSELPIVWRAGEWSYAGRMGSRTAVLAEVKSRGLRLAWGNEMTWLLPGESGALLRGLIDCILYTSAAQRATLEPLYEHLLGGTSEPPTSSTEALTGVFRLPNAGTLPWVMVGNYIQPAAFPWVDRTGSGRRFGEEFVIGRLSRDDYHKFPVNFPASYEGLGLQDPVRYRVMAWSEELAQRWPDHAFDARWDLLPAMAESPAAFLQSLDLLVYDTGPEIAESWGRAVVEAMLTGAIPLLPADPRHHLRELITPGESGYLCASADEFGHWARWLQEHAVQRRKLSRQAHEEAAQRHCAAARHLELWAQVFKA